MATFSRLALISLIALLSAVSAAAASLTIPAGAALAVRMMQPLDSLDSHSGEVFRATVDSPVMVNGRIVVPLGAEAIGRVTSVQQPGRFRGRAVLTLELTALNIDGKSVSVMTNYYQEAGGPRGKRTAIFSGSGGAAGALFGAVAGGPVGSLIGAGIGAAGGAVVQTVRGPEPVRIPAESLMVFTLLSPLTLELEY